MSEDSISGFLDIEFTDTSFVTEGLIWLFEFIELSDIPMSEDSISGFLVIEFIDISFVIEGLIWLFEFIEFKEELEWLIILVFIFKLI